MKNIRWVLILVFGFLFSNCEKEKADYRGNYTGNWEFKVNRIEVNTDSIGFYKNDSLVFAGTIKNANSKNEITIQYTKDNVITLGINETGELSNFPTSYCGGEFQGTTNLDIYLRWGGQGGGITHSIKGKKL